MGFTQHIRFRVYQNLEVLGGVNANANYTLAKTVGVRYIVGEKFKSE
jgi:hypothetical protein